MSQIRLAITFAVLAGACHSTPPPAGPMPSNHPSASGKPAAPPASGAKTAAKTTTSSEPVASNVTLPSHGLGSAPPPNEGNPCDGGGGEDMGGGGGDTSATADQLVGKWHGIDDDKWEYDLAVKADGSFTQVVHQTDQGKDCTQGGTVRVDSGTLVRWFRSNSCNTDYEGKNVHDTIESVDGAHLVLRMEGDYTIRYDRAP